MEIFTPLAPEFLADPYSRYAELRQTDPVHWHEGLGAYVMTRHSDCERILRDPSTFISDFRTVGDDAPPAFLSLQTLDPPEHTTVRRMVLSAMRKVEFDAWVKAVREEAATLLRSLGTEFDFVTDFAEPLGTRSMLLLFGMPSIQADETAYRSALRKLVLSMDAGLAPEHGPLGMEARAYLSELIEPWVVSPPTTGLLSHVGFDAVEAEDHRLFLLNSLRALFVAGYSSSSSMLGNAVRTLTEHGYFNSPEPRDFTAGMAHELVRFVGPVQAETRAVAKDTEVGSQSLTYGDFVVIIVASANRDEAIFEAANKLDLSRDASKHLGFGSGIHSCVGARLAISVLCEVISDLSKNFRIDLAGDPIQRPTATQRGLDNLPVHLNTR
ncbi:cytochrome P450 [Streptomyces sp. NPDC050538]|uniref:cytochrome P450 n=1 Tax=Streptomyces sp. NPDC050538 TaxID=3365627 RepID=UPI0037B49407